VAGAFFLASSDKEVAEPVDTRPSAQVLLSPSELAYVKGQMLGLSKHPGTMPEYEVDWVMKISEHEIRRAIEFADAPEIKISELTEAFFKGYTEQFDAYYNGDRAREAGYKYGLKWNPELHGMFPLNLEKRLLLYRDRLEADYTIKSEAEWRLFCQAFDRGFVQGYSEIKEGVTVQSRYQKIRLFDE